MTEIELVEKALQYGIMADPGRRTLCVMKAQGLTGCGLIDDLTGKYGYKIMVDPRARARHLLASLMRLRKREVRG